MSAKWFVYILECQDGSLYTGVTKDLDKRMKAHSEGKGSKYVAIKGFKQLLTYKEAQSQSEACKIESKIKSLPRSRKVIAIKQQNWPG
jgi:putative endonuclease